MAKARTDLIRPGRAKTAFYLLCAVAAFLTYRLYDVQVIEGPWLARQALEQRSETVETFARLREYLRRSERHRRSGERRAQTCVDPLAEVSGRRRNLREREAAASQICLDRTESASRSRRSLA